MALYVTVRPVARQPKAGRWPSRGRTRAHPTCTWIVRSGVS